MLVLPQVVFCKLLLVPSMDSTAVAAVVATAGMETHSTDEDVMRVFVPLAVGDHKTIFKAAAGFGVQVRHLRPSVPTLEDVFAKAIGEE